MINVITRHNAALAAAVAAASVVVPDVPAAAETPVATVTLPMLDDGVVITIRKAPPVQTTATVSGQVEAPRESPPAAQSVPASTVKRAVSAPAAPAPAAPAPVELVPAPAPVAAGGESKPAPVPDEGVAAPAELVPAPAPAGSESKTGTKTAVNSSNRSGMPWQNGVFAHSPDRVVRFQEKTGRPVDTLVVFPARDSWENVWSTWWLETAPPGFTGTLDVGVALWQDDGSLEAAASGAYNENWEKLGKLIEERYPGSSVRIGWEFNIGGWNHSANPENVEQWKQAYRHASKSLKKGGPSLLTTWNPNKGKGDSLPDASMAWPGDDVVDIVGLDAYDWWPAYNETTWPEHRDGDQGWKHWIDFARTHGKKFSAPEWGIAPSNGQSGGDNPYFIKVVMDLLKAEHAKDGIVHSASYFDEPADYIKNSIGDGQVPKAGEQLRTSLAEIAEGGSSSAATAGQPKSGTSGVPQSEGDASSSESKDVAVPAPVAAPAEGEVKPVTSSSESKDVAAPAPAAAPVSANQPADEQAQSGDGAWTKAEDGHGPVPAAS